MCGRLAPAKAGCAMILVHLSPETVERMQSLVAGKTDEALNGPASVTILGASLRRGSLSGTSLADRLLDRLTLLERGDD